MHRYGSLWNYMASCMNLAEFSAASFRRIPQWWQASGGGRSGAARAGVAQLVELQPSKLNVASSSLVSRSTCFQENSQNWPKHVSSVNSKPT
jgi:hypothetical protein